MIVVIGGGPAGLFAAGLLAGAGRAVTLLEKNEACGRKLLLSGGGRCNLTHAGTPADFLPRYGEARVFLRPALRGFPGGELRSFFAGLGLPLEEDAAGCFFPRPPAGARAVRDALAAWAAGAGAGLRLRCPAAALARAAGGGFALQAGGQRLECRAVLLAAGGRSWPQTGSTGDGYRLAAGLGHAIVEPRPALAPLTAREPFPLRGLAGLTLAGAGLALRRGGRLVARGAGDVLVTHGGISGPGALNLSRQALPGDVLEVTLWPGANAEEARLAARRALQARGGGPGTVKGVLRRAGIAQRLAEAALRAAGLAPDASCANLPRPAREGLVGCLAALPVPLAGVGGWDEAMVTAGGVDRREVNPATMESRLAPGLHFAGEVLDVDGECGGYNLHAAFATARLAARALAASGA